MRGMAFMRTVRHGLAAARSTPTVSTTAGFCGAAGVNCRRRAGGADAAGWRVRRRRMAGRASAMTWPPAGETGELATFAGGCFWGTELHFQRMHGVGSTAVGYTNGQTLNPTYEQVCSGMTGHAEAIQMLFDPNEVSYADLVDKHLATHSPTQLNAQGFDVGTQYRSGIYYHNEEQKEVAQERIKAWNAANGKTAVTEIEAAATFYPAEDYHQQYLSRGGRFGRAQSAAKGCTDTVRCYG